MKIFKLIKMRLQYWLQPEFKKLNIKEKQILLDIFFDLHGIDADTASDGPGFDEICKRSLQHAIKNLEVVLDRHTDLRIIRGKN